MEIVTLKTLQDVFPVLMDFNLLTMFVKDVLQAVRNVLMVTAKSVGQTSN